GWGAGLRGPRTGVGDVAGHAEIARALDLPVALGEAERTRWQFRAFLEAGAVDLLQPDVGRAGISEVRKIGVLAEAFHRPVALHCGLGVGPYIAASLQVGAAMPNLRWIEYQPDMHVASAPVLVQPLRRP